MPLSHLRIVDLTQVRSGPTCTRLLADFGAEVILERPGGEDRAREAFDAVDLHRGKKSVFLDLSRPEGLEVFRRLVPTADVLVQHALHGPMRVLAQPVRLHRTPARVTAPSPLGGQHTREVLDALGYDAPSIQRLLADGIVAETRAP
jgi:crotonobetainyl-CoA:carnitine CoA-transferase CaiB-like acyl-CoA transferase